jgi:hypothetical protein
LATFSAIALAPKSASGGVNDVQQITLVATVSQAITVGVRQIIAISISGAVSGDTPGTVGAHIRFGLGTNPTAAETDFFLPAGAPPILFDMGDEFDRVAFISAGTPVIAVMRMNKAS